MKTHNLFTVGAAIAVLSVMASLPISLAARPQQGNPKDFVPPIVFQAAGTTGASIQSTVDAYRAALRGDNHGNDPGPFADGRREINWDGVGAPNNLTTSLAGNPFNGFQVSRGALFTTDGTGFVQAPPAGLADATVFNNPTYATIFKAFSAARLFSAIGSNITDTTFFVPGPNNADKRAAVNGFGAVFTDVDQPDGGGNGRKHQPSTLIEYFDADDELLFSSVVPASPGDASFSFLGIVFEDARIARVRITTGNAVPGKDEGGKRDVVMMDDFIYGEPHLLP